jgi:murein DD-endopeptidase MepM/ murein hydrolase activator NlpD
MKTLLKLLLPAFALLAVAVSLVVTLRVGAPPTLALRPSAKAIGLRTQVLVTAAAPGRGLGALRVEVEQAGHTTVVARADGKALPAWRFSRRRLQTLELRAEVGRNAVATLADGEAVVRVVAERAPTWLRHPDPVVAELRLPVLVRPPVLSVVSTQHYVAQGGAGVVVYRVSETATRDGVRAGSWFFPGAPLPGATSGERFCLFGVPWDQADASAVRLVAGDAAGNTAEVAFVDRFTPRPPTRDRIELTDEFLGRVVPEIMAGTPGLVDHGDLVQNYLEINRELRQKNAAELGALGEHSTPRFLWKEPFLPLHNAKVMASFADQRTYVHAGAEIDHQTHLGFDLAVTARTPVPAANTGVVLLARYFGIYGNTVVLDHGFGLMTIYSHLSAIQAKEGQTLERGTILGLTGRTGLAGGDHLHFSTLLRGLPVTPAEWWDAHWIQDRIALRLAPAFVLEAAPASEAKQARHARGGGAARRHVRSR